MQALILAAGMGNRLGKYTSDNTKGMVEVNGEKLIDISLSRLYEVGIRKTILVIGYQADNLKQYVGDKFMDMDIVYVENKIYNKTNNIYSLWLAKDYLLADDTILLESDLIFEKKILVDLINSNSPDCAVVAPFERWMDGTVTILNKKNEIISFIPKKDFNWNSTDDYYKTVNIYKFSKKFSTNTYIPFLGAYIKTLGDNEYYEQVLRVVSFLDGIHLKAIIINNEKWYEVDDVQDLDIASVIFAKGEDKLNKMQSRYGGYWRFPRVLDFCYLVNPYFPTVTMLEEIKYNFATLTSEYPSGLNVINLLAAKMYNLFDEDNILVGNGAAELIKGIANTIKGSVGIVFPSFNEYSERFGYDRVVKFIPNNENLSYAVDDLINFSKDVENILLINPDNPTGNFISKDKIIKLLDYLKSVNKILIYDESFIDFVTKEKSISLIDDGIINTYDNLIIIQSISKSYGIPGMRLGVLVSSNKRVISSVRKELSIWNINSFGEYFLQVFGKYRKNYNKACDYIRTERDLLYSSLCEIDFLRPIPSQANYITCEVLKGTSKELAVYLLDKHAIFIKDLNGKLGIDGEFVRLAVRDNVDNSKLIKSLKAY
jgi:histidinol-phosphate/aromatic aminotransferase/cobyric acid decarboxylase-like protein/GTP:adenosylcobinamide-phosphate guanylyltransferase